MNRNVINKEVKQAHRSNTKFISYLAILIRKQKIVLYSKNGLYKKAMNFLLIFYCIKIIKGYVFCDWKVSTNHIAKFGKKNSVKQNLQMIYASIRRSNNVFVPSLLDQPLSSYWAPPPQLHCKKPKNKHAQTTKPVATKTRDRLWAIEILRTCRCEWGTFS